MCDTFDSVSYGNLPSPEAASIALHKLDIDNVINGPIRDVFIKHAVELVFCLLLQHSHHETHAGEAVVKVDGTVHLMNDQDIRNIASFGNSILPTSWMVIDKHVLPMEYSVVVSGATVCTPNSAFLKDFVDVLANNGCGDLFGIDTIAPTNWVEMSIGNASVVVPSNDNSLDNFVPVAFAFDQKDPKFRVHGKCDSTQNKHTSRPVKK